MSRRAGYSGSDSAVTCQRITDQTNSAMPRTRNPMRKTSTSPSALRTTGSATILHGHGLCLLVILMPIIPETLDEIASFM